MFKILYKNLNKTAFWVCLVISIILLVTSFILPPTGAIHPSVMQAVAEVFAFATLGTVIEGIHKGIDAKLTHGNTQLSLNNPDNQQNQETD